MWDDIAFATLHRFVHVFYFLICRDFGKTPIPQSINLEKLLVQLEEWMEGAKK